MPVTEGVKVQGLRELNRKLRQTSRELPRELRIALNEAAEIIAEAARDEVPFLSGAASGSIRVASTRTAARIKAGGRRAPYYPWLDFGGSVGPQKSVHRPFLRQGRYIYPALAEHREEFVAALEEALVRVAQQAGLEADTSG